MTCREKLKLEHPENFNPDLWGGVDTCPTVFGYLGKPDYCHDYNEDPGERCTRCWDREIPGTEEIKKENEIMPTDSINRIKKTKAELLEELEQANQNVRDLKNEIKNLERYKQYENAADELKALYTAFMNSGFTNEQAFEMLKMLVGPTVSAALRGMRV